MTEFRAWPKIKRLNKNLITITEKLDGTNSCIIIENGEVVGAQSRNRIVTPDDDNFGFARWVEENELALKTLGDGYHYGEWAGPGIQKNPHLLEEKTFFLFNVARHNGDDCPAYKVCKFVPVLYNGPYLEQVIDEVRDELQDRAIGIGVGNWETNPEGIMVFFHAFGSYLKYHVRDK